MRIIDLLRVLQSFETAGVTISDLKKAEKSKVTTETSKVFDGLLYEYSSGAYDEDIELLTEELRRLL